MKDLENLKKIIDTNLDHMDISPEAKEIIVVRTKTSTENVRFKRLKFILVPAAAMLTACAVLLAGFGGSGTVSTAYAKDLTRVVTPVKVQKVKISDDFIKSSADFSINIFKKSITENKNSLISPLSIYLALAMTANGADGSTLNEFQNVLGKYSLTMDDINRYSYSLSSSFKDGISGNLNIANSIWYRQADSLKVNKSFLQTDADYYGASAYSSDFNSNETVNDINNWVKSNTGKHIDKIVDKIDPDTMMYLINTLYFENEWQNKYTSDAVKDGTFTLDKGIAVTTKFMYSKESSYIEDSMAKGFVKPYMGGKFSFVALLPNRGVDVDSYAASLTGDKFISLIKNNSYTAVTAGLPKFVSEYSKDLVEPLKSMGLVKCFNESTADFRRMGSSSSKNLYIGDILQKTFIQVDELGTKAGAVTSVQVTFTSAPLKTVNLVLDRPFVYAIIDNKTNLPLFIGTMHDPR